MKQTILNYIEQTHMLERGDRLVLGVSGGADSVCLLRILCELRQELELELFAVHINHGLRGEEALRDQQFTEQLCSAVKVPCTTVAVAVRAYAAQEGLSEEEAGRRLRYQEFCKVAEQFSCKKIAVAHHMDDNAETVLFRIFRGTGLAGLSGIRPIGPCPETKEEQEFTVIRPLLCVNRAEIEQYLVELGQNYCEDSTNLSSDYARNLLRNEILPLVQEGVNAKAVENLNALAQRAFAAEQYLEEQATRLYEQLVTEQTTQEQEQQVTEQQAPDWRVCISKKLKEQPPVLGELVVKQAVIRAAGSRRDITSTHIATVLELFHKQVGSRVSLPYGLTASCEYDGIVLQKTEEYRKPIEVTEIFSLPHTVASELQQTVELPGGQGILLLSVLKQEAGNQANSEKNMINSKNGYTKCFDYDKIQDTVSVRTASAEDCIVINPSGGTKRLNDYFSDIKLPRTERGKQLVVALGHQILWVLGKRTGENYRVSPQTKYVLWITWLPNEKEEKAFRS